MIMKLYRSVSRIQGRWWKWLVMAIASCVAESCHVSQNSCSMLQYVSQNCPKPNIFLAQASKHAELPVRYASREGSERSLSISSGVRQVYTTSRIYLLVLAKTEHIILYYTKTCWDYTILVQLSSGLNQRWCSQAHCSTSSAPWGPSCCSSKSSGGTHEDPRFNRVSTEYQVPTSAYKSLQVYTLACTSRFLEDKMQE